MKYPGSKNLILFSQDARIVQDCLVLAVFLKGTRGNAQLVIHDRLYSQGTGSVGLQKSTDGWVVSDPSYSIIFFFTGLLKAS